MKRTAGGATPWALLAIWALAVSGGTVALSAYQLAPGRAADAPSRWPLASRAHLDRTRPTLVMSLHPMCACSRASVGELARLMTRLDHRVHALALVVIPNGLPAHELARSDLVAQARLVPDTEIVIDRGGAIASRFDAKTSGQTYLYETDGSLVFSGGLTEGRGHMGDSAGRARILAHVFGRERGRAESAVFGCGLEDPSPRRAN